MKTVIIVQARMTSTRLPGKVLLPVLGKPLLEYQIERLQRVTLADKVIIATTVNPTDQPIVDLCDRLGVAVYRGDEADVLSRYYEAARTYGADVIVRVTSDCPLIDPQIIDTVIQHYFDQQPAADYAANTLRRSLPRGMDTEVFSMSALTAAHQEATAQPDREHVTPFIHQQPERFAMTTVSYDDDQSQHRWTVDTPEDFALIQKILVALYPHCPKFTLADCLNLLEQNPEWRLINAHVEQKKYGE
ncbi:cytidylyltransferase domain-containing protein [Leptolyngbya iicbica]|uniref:Acylneuraminate cytidylyltransferase n=2 Tax=Cyanophyceae TaxID=3028117 RepID=A0A4V2E3N5_9CYAN|nr:glycosyltransferase family protein [Leptolyngbya sp. LK]RZM83060.1 acylneuraminate cytidylyltransferase [Leptolyngbya sp. LK]